MDEFIRDESGFEYNQSIPDRIIKEEPKFLDLPSMPLTNIVSPTSLKQSAPLIMHTLNPKMHPNKLEVAKMDLNRLYAEKLEKWGDESPVNLDWNSLKNATEELITGVIQLDIRKVESALKNNADPSTIVFARDPFADSKDPDPKYVPVPIGVAAVMLGEELSKYGLGSFVKNKTAEIARMLLIDDSKPSIEIGNSNDFGSAISFTAMGIKLEGDFAGMESFEAIEVPITLSLRNSLSNILPECMVENVHHDTDGLAWGEKVPFSDFPLDGVNLKFSIEGSFEDSLNRFRERRQINQNTPDFVKNKLNR